MMCPGTEFGIMDTLGGVIFAAATITMVIMGIPWYLWIFMAVSTIGWFAMAVHCFRFAAKCTCQELEVRPKGPGEKL